MTIVGLKFSPFPLEQALPVVFGWDDAGLVVGRLGDLVCHLEKEQEGDLFRVGHVGEAIITENMGEVPCLVDDLLGVVCGHLDLAFAFLAFLGCSVSLLALILSRRTATGSSFGS